MARRRLAGVVLVALMTVLGCAEGSPGGGGDSGGSGGNGGGNGGNGDTGNGAVGAPINIPSIVQDQGRPLIEVQSEIEASVREQCGDGELCIELQVAETDPNFGTCQFVRTEPPQGTSVDRGSTVLIVAGTQECEETEGPTDDATDDDGLPDDETSDGT